MSKSKGFMGLILLIVIWAGIFLSLYILQAIHLNKILKIKGELNVFIESNDEGTEFVGFLQSKKDLVSYMGVLGSSSAANFPEDFSKDITSTLEKIKKTMKYNGYILTVSDPSGNVIKQYPEKAPTLPTSTPAASTPVTTGSLSLEWPVDKNDVERISSGFGWRDDPYVGFHGGIDFSALEGTEVRAAADGKVDHAGWQNSNNHKEGMGLYVRIQHQGNYYTYYAHLSKADVIVGQKVSKGDKIGESGDTGESTGPHLHFEMRQDKNNNNVIEPTGVDSVNVCPYLGCPKISGDCQQNCIEYNNGKKSGCGQTCQFAGLPGESVEIVSGNAQSMNIPIPGGQKGFAELMTW